MAVELTQEIINALLAKDSLKVLASVDGEGRPYVVAKDSVSIDDEGRLYYLELLESSRTNKNLVRSIWFDKWIAINVITSDKRSFQIRGKAVKTLVAGHEYEKYYEKIQECNQDNDLAAVYYIQVEEVREETYLVRKAEQEKNHPLYVHLDRLAATME